MTIEKILESTDDIFNAVFFPVYNHEPVPESLEVELIQLLIDTSQTIDTLESEHTEAVVMSEQAPTSRQRKEFQRKYKQVHDDLLFLLQFRCELHRLLSRRRYNNSSSLIHSMFKLLIFFEVSRLKRDYSSTFETARDMYRGLVMRD